MSDLAYNKIGLGRAEDLRGQPRKVKMSNLKVTEDMEVGLNKVEELPYVMGLVRQAFEKQMGDGESGA